MSMESFKIARPSELFSYNKSNRNAPVTEEDKEF